MLVVVLTSVLLLLIAIGSLHLDTDNDLRNKIEMGKQQLQVLLSDDSDDPLCWRDNILTLMDKQCGALNYQSRSSTAVKLTLCHLKQSGINNINEADCDATTSNTQCMEQIASNEVAFSTYNHFFTSIDNICIYIQMRDHDTNIKKGIHDLYTATLQSSDYLKQTHQKQMKFQNEILNKQTKIKQTNHELLKFHKQHQNDINNLE
eukprot:126213_1